MAGLHLYRGNRLEDLLDPLAERITRNASLFLPDTIVVQGRGMVPYIQRELAVRQGIAANLKFPYPNRLLRDLFGLVSPRPFPFDLNWLAWRIMALLPGLLEEAEFAGIARYLKKENAATGATGSQRRLYRLSRQIADVFDQYIIHRPDMMAAWSRSDPPEVADEQLWQVRLWRALFPGERLRADGLLEARAGNHELNPIVLKERLIDTLGTAAIRELLPDRLFLFGLSILPALHREIFAFLGERIELHVFALDAAPAPDPNDRPRPTRDAKNTNDANDATAALAVEDARLFAGVSANFADDIAAAAKRRGVPVELHRFYRPPARTTLLAALQNDCFEKRAGPLPADDSFSVHACHSPLREVEVLYNYLLDLFRRRPDLGPADVLIAAPHPETYAPLIQAVFAGEDNGEGDANAPGDTGTDANQGNGDAEARGEIPVRVLGWHPGSGAGLEALLALWKLFSGRFRAEELLEVLELPAVRERRELGAPELQIIRKLVERAGVRWGRDAAHRAGLDLPAMGEHTWRFGLDRLVLGYALSDEETICETGDGPVLPVDALEGENALLFARFLDFVDDCARYADRLARPRQPAAWAALLRELAAQFLSERAAADLESTLDRFAELAIDPGYADALGARVIPGMIEDLYNDGAAVRGGPGGSVTFASLLPARQIPFAVVCLVGLNQADFPTRPIQPSFDLLDEKREYRRQEETRLFLEQLLSAREEFFVSYVGRNIYNNRVCQPSSLLGELCEHVERGGVERGRVLREHRLQPFHPAYFQPGDEGLYSYVGAHLDAARALLADRRPPPGLFDGNDRPARDAQAVANGEDANGETLQELTLDEFIAFFTAPAEYYLRNRLKLNPGEIARLIPEAEPFQLEPIDAYRLKRGLVDSLLEEDPDPALFEDGRRGALFTRYFEKFRAAGLLPHGRPGEVIFRAHFAEASLFFADMQARVDTRRIQRRRFAGPETGRFRVYLGAHDEVAFSGRLPADDEGLLLYRPALLKGRDLLTCWIRHLVLNLTGTGDQGAETLFVARPAPAGGRARKGQTNRATAASVALHRLRPLDQNPGRRRERARELLEELLRLYQAGSLRPLPFFPETSLAYYRVLADGGEETFALKEARSRWHLARPGFEQGEFTQPALQLCFAKNEPVHPDARDHDAFRRLAGRLYRPIFQYLQENVS